MNALQEPMGDFRRLARVATVEIRKHRRDVWVDVQWKRGRLSIVGVEGPLPSGTAAGSIGQCYGQAASWQALPGIDLARLVAVWDMWCLNDMQPGTPRQMAIIRRRRAEWDKSAAVSHYNWAQRVLEEEGLLVDEGYRYGTGWLYVEVPEDILQWLTTLPDESAAFPWPEKE
jgi:hypothetical protein